MHTSALANLRVGIGYDTHIFELGRKLYLGGVQIPYKAGLLAHSDGDVLLHAIADAVLGASGLGDIGQLFPPSDTRYKDISSVDLLKDIVNRVEKGYFIISIDSVLICEKPKIADYSKDMQQKIKDITKTQHISVKASTSEGMNDEGRGLCISAQAVALLEKKKN